MRPGLGPQRPARGVVVDGGFDEVIEVLDHHVLERVEHTRPDMGDLVEHVEEQMVGPPLGHGHVDVARPKDSFFPAPPELTISPRVTP